MRNGKWMSVSTMLVLAGLPYSTGCASVCEGKPRAARDFLTLPCNSSRCKSNNCDKKITKSTEVRTTSATASSDLPPNAAPGECYAKVFFPPTFKTVSERICVRPASEEIEVVPAQYEWRDKQVVIRPAETKFEVVPAQYETREQTVMVDAGHTGWEREMSRCANTENNMPREVVCLVNHPPVYEKVQTQCLVTPAHVREVTIPAEYGTVREQVCVSPATTRKIAVPAEEKVIEKTVKVADGGMRWELVLCERQASNGTTNKIKKALVSAGYTPGPANGELAREDWSAIETFQKENGLGVGALTYATLNKLGVDPDN